MREILAWLLDLVGGGQGLFIPRHVAVLDAGASLPLVILSPGNIPTTDIYIRARLPDFGPGSVEFVDSLQTSPSLDLPHNRFSVIIVRHAPKRWLVWLEQHRDHIVSLTLLLDDDIPAAMRARELPFRYALKTAWRYARARRTLSRLCTGICVSTPELQRRYAQSRPRLCPPVYIPATALSERSSAPVYFYHGTWAHRREIAWLVEIVREVQKRCPEACFEIMGRGNVARMFRDIPRVRVVAPMAWPDYLAYASARCYQLGLAPCFDTPFNRARSHVKVFDITRLGAAGIYSDMGAYAATIEHRHTGYLCANQQQWADAICLLLDDGVQRERLHAAALAWCLQTRPSVENRVGS